MKFNYFNILLNFIKEKHKDKFIALEEICDGGSSYNFQLKTTEGIYFLKLIAKSDKQRIEKILQLLQCFDDATVTSPDELKTTDEIYSIILMPYVEGHKLTTKQLHPTLYLSLQVAYQHIFTQQVPEKYVFAQQTLHEIKTKIDNILPKEKSFDYKLISYLFWHRFSQQLITLPPTKQIIHGDFSLKNILVDKIGKPHIMDFELVRFGYATEDWAMLLLQLTGFSKLWGNLDFFQKMYMSTQDISTDKQQWLYGVQMYYLERLRRRLTDKRKKHNWRKNLCFLCSLMRYFAVEKLILNR